MTELKNFDHYNPITHKIIGCAMEVHKFLGNGFQEVIYQRALSIEFDKQEVSYQREIEVPIFYYDQEIGKRRVDFLVHEKVLVELKAVSEIDNNHMNQIMNYLEAYKLEIGLLINFGENSLKFKRFVKSNHKYKSNL